MKIAWEYRATRVAVRPGVMAVSRWRNGEVIAGMGMHYQLRKNPRYVMPYADWFGRMWVRMQWIGRKPEGLA